MTDKKVVERKEGFYGVFGYLRLHRCRYRRLQVVGLQVALQVQDLQVIRLRQGEQLAERSVRVDRLLIHQALRLGVVAHLLRDGGARDQGALGNAEELAQRIGHGRGLREDRGLCNNGLAVLGHRRCLAATALGDLLDLAGQLLLELLDRRANGANEGPGLLNLLGQGGELIDNVHLVSGDSGSRLRNDRRNNRRSRRSRRSRRNNGGLRRLGGRGGNNGGGRHGNNGRGGNGGLLGSTLYGGGGAHCVISVSEEFFRENKRGGGEC